MLHQSVKASDVIAILRRRWILIVVLAVTGGAAAFVASRILPKRFTSQTLVLVQQPTVSPQLVPTLVSDNSNQQLAAMQQEILSRARLEPVIQELNLYPNDVGQVSMEELVERLRRSMTEARGELIDCLCSEATIGRDLAAKHRQERRRLAIELKRVVARDGCRIDRLRT